MNKNFTVAFALVATLAIATLANSRTNQRTHLPDVLSPNMVALATTPQDAETLIRTAEVLMASHMLSAAEVLVNKAHVLDPTAPRVAFYHAGFSGLRGLSLIPEMHRQLKRSLGMEANSFLGKRFRGTRYALQNVLRNNALPLLVSAADEFRTISGSLHLHITEDAEFQCTGEGEVWECRKNHELSSDERQTDAHRSVDSVDREILVGYLWSVADFVRIFTAYSLEGYEAADRLLNPTKEDIAHVAPRLGTLNNDHQLATIQQTTAAGAALTFGLFDLVSRSGSGNANYRQNIFGSLYFDPEMIKTLRTLSNLLRGPKSVRFVNAKGVSETIMVDIARMLKNPPRDLQRLFPETGSSSYPDPTIGGLFPDGDAPRLNGSASAYAFLNRVMSYNPLTLSLRRVGQW